jgi:hypothetical protein
MNIEQLEQVQSLTKCIIDLNRQTKALGDAHEEGRITEIAFNKEGYSEDAAVLTVDESELIERVIELTRSLMNMRIQKLQSQLKDMIARG